MSISDQNNSYRRGVILGLTLAEIMLLILFLLLLTFAFVLNREKIHHEQQKQLLSKNKNIEKVANILEKSDPSITDELVEAFEQLPYLANLIKKENLKKDEHESTKQVFARAIDKLVSEKSIAKGKDDLSLEEKLQESLSENKVLQSQIANLQGQNKNILNKLNSQGKGADYPPCWVDSKGKAEFIYNIYLSNDGITIEDNKLPHRRDEQANLPISHVIYDEPISQIQFTSQTTDLKKWADAHECHFYVKIYDKTDGNEKNLYKSLLRTVESSFYKILMMG